MTAFKQPKKQVNLYSKNLKNTFINLVKTSVTAAFVKICSSESPKLKLSCYNEIYFKNFLPATFIEHLYFEE